MENDAAVLGRRWFQEVWNDRRDEAITELMAPDAVGHMEGGDAHGPEGFRNIRAMFLQALPDLHITVENVLSDGNQVAVRWRARGTHAGELMGIPATGQKVDFCGTSWINVRDGQLAEGWDTWNLGGLVETLRSAAQASQP